MPLSVDSLNSGTIKTESLTVAGESVGSKYKVYSALLTQSGGDVDSFLIDNGLVIGITYQITPYGNTIGVDFTNIGAPNNDAGTYFVATGTIPNSWGNNTDDSPVLRYNTGAPVVTVLENTIGNIWFTYNGDGDFWVQTSTLIFNPLKTIIFLGETNDVDNEFKNERPNENGQNEIGLYTFSSGIESNNILQKTSIEIRVYN